MTLAAHAMTCTETVDRLVAFQDGELSPSEVVQLTEHLEHCEACSELHERLLAVTPEPALVVPPEIQLALERQLDEALRVAREETPRPRRRPASDRFMAWLRRDTELSFGAILAYAALLLLAVSWGAANWWDAANLRAQVEQSPTELTPAGEIPAGQYKPASYVPEEDGFH